MTVPTHSQNHAARLQRIRRLSHVLDNAIGIPGTRIRFGLDPLLGLLPGGGDTASAVLSAYIVFEAARFGVPRELLMQMVGNLLLDATVGSVPVLGDLFDVTWKANTRNMALLESHLGTPASQRKVDYAVLIVLAIVLLAFIVGVATIAFFVVSFFWHLIAQGLAR